MGRLLHIELTLRVTVTCCKLRWALGDINKLSPVEHCSLLTVYKERSKRADRNVRTTRCEVVQHISSETEWQRLRVRVRTTIPRNKESRTIALPEVCNRFRSGLKPGQARPSSAGLRQAGPGRSLGSDASVTRQTGRNKCFSTLRVRPKLCLPVNKRKN